MRNKKGTTPEKEIVPLVWRFKKRTTVRFLMPLSVIYPAQPHFDAVFPFNLRIIFVLEIEIPDKPVGLYLHQLTSYSSRSGGGLTIQSQSGEEVIRYS